MRIEAFIPIRAGSAGIPGKNKKLLGGIPLVCHTIDAALQAVTIDNVHVITESIDLAKLAKRSGAGVLWRPDEMATSQAQIEPSYLLAVKRLFDFGKGPDLCVLLHATSPFRTGAQIDGAVGWLIESGADSLLTVVQSDKFHWRLNAEKFAEADYDYRSRPNRQDMKPAWIESSAIYITKTPQLLEGKNRLCGNVAIFEIDALSGWDIDEPWEFEMADSFLKGDNVNEIFSRARMGEPVRG